MSPRSYDYALLHRHGVRQGEASARPQAENYRRRAANRMIKWKHAGCQVALMAPKEFIEKHPNEARHFDFTITYEEVGVYVPEFREMCS